MKKGRLTWRVHLNYLQIPVWEGRQDELILSERDFNTPNLKDIKSKKREFTDAKRLLPSLPVIEMKE